jgi:hypothetical protein
MGDLDFAWREPGSGPGVDDRLAVLLEDCLAWQRQRVSHLGAVHDHAHRRSWPEARIGLVEPQGDIEHPQRA